MCVYIYIYMCVCVCVLTIISRNDMSASDLIISPAASSSNDHQQRPEVSGILYKWVNYGKGWRPRWFVLQDGVLSLYKIHGPDKIMVNQETEEGTKVIGQESAKRMLSKNGYKDSSSDTPKPVGQIHLKVASIRESRSDNKRFSIFTGTKRLHLRAESKEARKAWTDALQATKEKFPRISNSELMAPVDHLAISTEKLRQRLMKEGVSEIAIRESEQIMKDEFIALRNQLFVLKKKQCLLMDTVRQLELHVVISRISVPSRNTSSFSTLNSSVRSSITSSARRSVGSYC